MSIYLYGLLPTNQLEDSPFYAVKGIERDKTCFEIVEKVTAVFCYLSEEEFDESVLKEKMDNPKWVHKHAIHHHETIVTYSKNYLFLPSKFCTVYSSIEKLREDLSQEQLNIVSLFEQLKEKEEWNVKMYYDKSKFFKVLERHSKVIQNMNDELKILSPGKQFFMKKKQGQLLENEAQTELRLISQSLENTLLNSAFGSKTRKNWSKNATGRNVDMIYNSTSLIPKDSRKKFELLIKEFRQKYEDKGIIVEISGPWPFYHFASLETRNT
ncbi:MULTISPECIES: GvpL/GvpF family gas vesicle protein [unclassified Bacillus (in: firmicutes)]|uniref:GvpL/GvpF family gas vesicle protein n=1 Tax=unclassified Bacillus (in: firmicutes) TaxID=185979 RepID=UPI001596EB8F|nr:MULTISPECIES: GvpL/GvpF family gas vesicle protein [unclassified Bacillus (in: firmicutes)]